MGSRNDKPWTPSHRSVEDGSTARLVTEHPTRHHWFVMENEEGTQWLDPASLWEPL